MRPGRQAAKFSALTGLIGLTLSTLTVAADVPLATALARCAALASSAARLACYDILAGRDAHLNAAPSPEASTALAPAVAMPAPVPATPPSAARPVAPVAVLPAAPTATAEPADALQNFGLSASQRHAVPQGPQAIEARIAQITVDQVRGSSVLLDNGQTWVSTEGEMELTEGERVTISRAVLGSFMLVSAVSHHSYHVRRVH